MVLEMKMTLTLREPKTLREPNWPLLVRHLRFTLGHSQTDLAKQLRVDQATVSRWESGSQVPDFGMQFAIRNKLHKCEPIISRAFVEQMPVQAILYDMDTFGLCVAASQPLAHSYALDASEFRCRTMFDIWSPSISSAIRALAESPHWRSNNVAAAKAKICRRNGDWLDFIYSPVAGTSLCLAIGAFTDVPFDLAETDFKLEIIPKEPIIGHLEK